MLSTREFVDTARMRYMREMSSTEALIHDHLARSALIIKQVKSSANALYYGFTLQTQSSYAKGLSNNQSNIAKENCLSESTADGLELPYFPINGESSSSSKHVTQAAWIAQMMTVYSNLSKISNWEDTVKIPEILLTDPVDVLCDTKAGLTKEHEEEKDMLSQLLNDTSYEIAREADISNSYRSGNLFSANMASILEYNRDVEAVPQSAEDRQLVDTLLNDTFTGLETLSHEWPALKGHMQRSADAVSSIPQSLSNVKSAKLTNIDSLYMKTFGTRSGIINSDKNHALTHALLHINELDKNKEANLAPKMCTTAATVKPDSSKQGRPVRSASSESTSAPQYSDNSGNCPLRDVLSLSPGRGNLLESINILSEEKLGIKLNKLSEFERQFGQMAESKGTSVEVQTEDMIEPEAVDEKEETLPPRIKVIYAKEKEQIPGIRERRLPLQITTAQTVEDNMADKLIKDVQPRLELPLQHITTEIPFVNPNSSAPTIQERRELYQRQMRERDEMARRQWKERHAPLYDNIRMNARAGLSMSVICRGGRRGGSRLSRASKVMNDDRGSYQTKERHTPRINESQHAELGAPFMEAESDNIPESLIYQSPSEKSRMENSLIYESPSNKISTRQAVADAKGKQEQKHLALQRSIDESPEFLRDYYGYDEGSGINEYGSLSARGAPFFAAQRRNRAYAQPSQLKKPGKRFIAVMDSPSLEAYNAFNDFDGWWRQNSIPLGTVREQLSIS